MLAQSCLVGGGVLETGVDVETADETETGFPLLFSRLHSSSGHQGDSVSELKGFLLPPHSLANWSRLLRFKQ